MRNAATGANAAHRKIRRKTGLLHEVRGQAGAFERPRESAQAEPEDFLAARQSPIVAQTAPYRHLAMAVLDEAFANASVSATSDRTKYAARVEYWHDAVAFFERKPKPGMFFFETVEGICEVLSIATPCDPGLIRRQARILIDAARPHIRLMEMRLRQ